MSATTSHGRPCAALALRRLLLVLTGALLVAAIYGALFTVDVTEYGVVSRFGHIVRVVDTPGLHEDCRSSGCCASTGGCSIPSRRRPKYLTSDKKNVVVRSLATWRIADPERFLETVRNRAGAEELQLADLVHGEVGAVLGKYPFASFVSAGGGQSQFVTLVAEVHDAVQACAAGVRDRCGRARCPPSSTCRRRTRERVRAHEGRAGQDRQAVPLRGRARRQAPDRRGGARADPDHRRGLRAGGAHQGRGRSRGDGDLRRRVRGRRPILQVPAHPAGLPRSCSTTRPRCSCRPTPRSWRFAGERRCPTDAPASLRDRSPGRRSAALRRTGPAKPEQPRLEASDDHTRASGSDGGTVSGWRRVRGSALVAGSALRSWRWSAAYLATGFYVVNTDEQAVVRRFGALAARVGPACTIGCRGRSIRSTC